MIFSRKQVIQPTSPADPQTSTDGPQGFFQRLRQRVNKGQSWLTRDMRDLFTDIEQRETVFETLEERLIQSDVGVELTERLLETTKSTLKRNRQASFDDVVQALREQLLAIVTSLAQPLDVSAHQPFVLLVVGVNGSGKTTTIGKIAAQLKSDNKKVLLAAGDTFRAAAIEQLQVWGERNEMAVIAQQSGADPAAVIFDAVEAAKARQADVLIADTAGRLHTQDNLMKELQKVTRVVKKIDQQAPHEVLLVIDATLGQNALQQARVFHEALGVTGLAITKLDGTAKAGVLLAIADELKLPIRWVGIGESAEDLGWFDADAYCDGLLGIDY